MSLGGQRRKWVSAVLLLTALVAVAVSLPVIRLLAAPVLSPLLPRPAIVPRGATAYWDWKGSGDLAWTWCEETQSGRLLWLAADGGEFVHVALKTAKCTGSVRKDGQLKPDLVYLYDSPFDPFIHLLNPEPLSSGIAGSARRLPCNFTLSASRIGRYRRVVDESLAQTAEATRRRVLDGLRRQLAGTDGAHLSLEDLNTCTNRPHSRDEAQDAAIDAAARPTSGARGGEETGSLAEASGPDTAPLPKPGPAASEPAP